MSLYTPADSGADALQRLSPKVASLAGNIDRKSDTSSTKLAPAISAIAYNFSGVMANRGYDAVVDVDAEVTRSLIPTVGTPTHHGVGGLRPH